MKSLTTMRNAVLTLAALAAASTSAFAQQTPPPTISVTGEATISVAPDLAQVDGGVTSEAKTAREASEANNKAMTAVMAALKSAGIAAADIQTSRLSLQPQNAPPRPGARAPIVGYQASNRVTVRIRDVTKVANTIDTLVTAGANDIGGIIFMVSKQSQLLDEARGKAIDDARRKADVYAKATNVRLGAPVSITEEGSGGPVPMMRAQYKADAVGAPVSPGEETLRISVQVSYELKSATP
jgi:uncharacterized protein YggE